MPLLLFASGCSVGVCGRKLLVCSCLVQSRADGGRLLRHEVTLLTVITTRGVALVFGFLLATQSQPGRSIACDLSFVTTVCEAPTTAHTSLPISLPPIWRHTSITRRLSGCRVIESFLQQGLGSLHCTSTNHTDTFVELCTTLSPKLLPWIQIAIAMQCSGIHLTHHTCGA